MNLEELASLIDQIGALNYREIQILRNIVFLRAMRLAILRDRKAGCGHTPGDPSASGSPPRGETPSSERRSRNG